MRRSRFDARGSDWSDAGAGRLPQLMPMVGVGAVAGRLCELGLEKRSGLVFTLPLDGGGVLGWVGLNKATRRGRSGEVLLNPVVGVRHQELEKIVADLRGEKFHRYLPPTVSSPLRYLIPVDERRDWLVTGEAGDEVVADDLVAAVGHFGFEFMRAAGDLRGLIAALSQGHGHAHQNAYRLPVALLMLGGAGDAERFVDREVDSLGVRSDPAAEEFRAFVDRLRSTALG